MGKTPLGRLLCLLTEVLLFAMTTEFGATVKITDYNIPGDYQWQNPELQQNAGEVADQCLV